jgi:hypothetical protein
MIGLITFFTGCGRACRARRAIERWTRVVNRCEKRPEALSSSTFR